MNTFIGFVCRIFVVGTAFLFLAGCGGNSPLQDIDTPTRGTIKLAVDDSYQLLMDTEIYTFESLYQYSKFNVIYRSEADVLQDFLNDSVPLIVVNRKLTTDEEAYLSDRQIVPKTTRIAYDAVALIVNNENPDSMLYFDVIKKIFTGEVSEWSQINPTSGFGNIKVVFDNYKSGNPRYFREKFDLDSLPSNCYAVNTNEDVISFIENNPNAIGVISVNWVSDRRDSVSNDFLTRIKVVGVSQPGNNEPDGNFYQPYQAYIAEGLYPFIREVFCINRQTYSGLAYGLTAFVAGEKGQLIVLHSGLVPATMPVRIVEIKH